MWFKSSLLIILIISVLKAEAKESKIPYILFETKVV